MDEGGMVRNFPKMNTIMWTNFHHFLKVQASDASYVDAVEEPSPTSCRKRRRAGLRRFPRISNVVHREFHPRDTPGSRTSSIHGRSYDRMHIL